ncbi:hypothetical protein GGX14DRAFT_394846 [Mycena pura]|uniref:Uncharacterized protein n=1 Tax=Mycena pura TaxID=153505 RepID=A0AAD6VHR2_9AGAR|nr:hypothetical protein GGX14DRAFT_394846 [Mycena pura]
MCYTPIGATMNNQLGKDALNAYTGLFVIINRKRRVLGDRKYKLAASGRKRNGKQQKASGGKQAASKGPRDFAVARRGMACRRGSAGVQACSAGVQYFLKKLWPVVINTVATRSFIRRSANGDTPNMEVRHYQIWMSNKPKLAAPVALDHPGATQKQNRESLMAPQLDIPRWPEVEAWVAVGLYICCVKSIWCLTLRVLRATSCNAAARGHVVVLVPEYLSLLSTNVE